MTIGSIDYFIYLLQKARGVPIGTERRRSDGSVYVKGPDGWKRKKKGGARSRSVFAQGKATSSRLRRQVVDAARREARSGR